MIRKFRIKPVVIEAVQFNGKNKFEICEFIGANRGSWTRLDFDDHHMTIKTLGGDMQILPFDWVIKGFKDEFYPCDPDIFEMTYEEI